MEDKAIVALYLARNEEAIVQTERHYGTFCRSIALGILGTFEDAKECANDTYHVAWNRIPPDRPQRLAAYLGRIVRNISVSRYRADHAQKRYAPGSVLLSELGDCIPDPRTPETILEGRELGQFISRWLRTLGPEERYAFVRRYWYADSLEDVAKQLALRPNTLAQRLRRLRKQLKTALEQEGVVL